MLIVCPNCATSYMIEPASVGPAGRGVRCARCKTTWFAGGPTKTPEVTAFVSGVIAEAQAQSDGGAPTETRAQTAKHKFAASDDFGGEPPQEAQPEIESPAVEPAAPYSEPVAVSSHQPVPFTITDAPSLVPPIEHAPLPQLNETEFESEDAETFTARRARLKTKRTEARRSSRWTAIILVLFAFNVALIGARNEVVRYLPQTASLFAAIGLPVNLRNLKFENVRISKDGEGGASMLIVEGTIVSTSNKPAEVPRLRFAARNAAGQEVYTWTALATRSILGPGESLEFSSRIAAPPADASDVMVRFFNAQDTLPGTK
ncbi:MAG: MJ0042-type zinc finger domain-containing protein [Pseudolabrys sp.]